MNPVIHNGEQNVFSFTVTCRSLTNDWISQISILNLETKESIFTFKTNILLSALILKYMKYTYPEKKSKHPSYQSVNPDSYNNDLPGKNIITDTIVAQMVLKPILWDGTHTWNCYWCQEPVAILVVGKKGRTYSTKRTPNVPFLCP